VAGIALWVSSHFATGKKKKIDKRHPGILRIYEWVHKQYEQGRITSISPEEIMEQARRHLPDYF
jgi:hypothetical protein